MESTYDCLFVTGATGYVGRWVLGAITPQVAKRVRCLMRQQSGRPPTLPDGVQVEWVTGDLADRGGLAERMQGCDAALHLAAATGKHSPLVYEQTNVLGSKNLVAACHDVGIKSALLVSTIAVRFEKRAGYHYAESKIAAEQVFRNSGLDWTILRPTMVMGPESPVLSGLNRLTQLPVCPLFDGGKARVQPIAVSNLAASILKIVRTRRFRGETLEVGGPEVLTLKELLLRLSEYNRRKPPRFVNIPVSPIRRILRFLEPACLKCLPLTAGQLATFANDGVASPNWAESTGCLESLEQSLESAAEM